MGSEGPEALAATQSVTLPLLGESGRSLQDRHSEGLGRGTEAHLIQTQARVIQATGSGVRARLQVCPALIRAAAAHVEVWWEGKGREEKG